MTPPHPQTTTPTDHHTHVSTTTHLSFFATLFHHFNFNVTLLGGPINLCPPLLSHSFLSIPDPRSRACQAARLTRLSGCYHANRT